MAQQIDFEQYADKEAEDPFAQFADPIPETTSAPVQNVTVTPPVETPVEESGNPIWNAVKWFADTPVTDFPSRVGNYLADKIDAPSLDRTPFDAQTRGLLAGITKGIGDAATGMFTPSNIVATAATGGANLALRSGARGARMLSKAALAADAVPVVHGATTALNPMSNASLGERGAGAVEAALGGLGAASLMPSKNVLDFPASSKALPTPAESERALLDFKDYDSTKITQPDAPLDPMQSFVVEQNKVGAPRRLIGGPELTSSGGQTVRAMPTHNYVDTPNPKVGLSVAKAVQTKRPVPQMERVEEPPVISNEVLKNTAEVGNAFKAINSSWDSSIPGRQGRSLMFTKEWMKSWVPSVKAIGSQKSHDAVLESILERPNYRPGDRGVSFADEAGLEITNPRNKREEESGSAWAEKWYPGVAHSARAASAFSNKLRADTFDSLIDQADSIYKQAKEMGRARRGWFTESFDNATDIEKLNPRTNLVLAKQIANFVNNATGRGSLGKDSKIQALGDLLNGWIFSPRLMKSRLELMNPQKLMFATPFVRKQYQKAALTTASSWLAMAGMAKMLGAEVSSDPDSSEFGKIQTGETRHDPGAGFQQYLVLMHRLGKGTWDSATGNPEGRYAKAGQPYQPTFSGDLGSFARNKLSPLAGAAWDFVTADAKKPFELGGTAMELTTPFSWQSISEMLQEDPSWANALGLVSEGIGMTGNTTYKSGQYGPDSRLLPESVWPRKYDLAMPRPK